MKKNLLFYCWIDNIDNLTIWTQWNLKLLKKYINVFDGNKIIYVGIDNYPTNLFIEKIKNIFHFANSDITDIVCVKNNPNVALPAAGKDHHMHEGFA